MLNCYSKRDTQYDIRKLFNGRIVFPPLGSLLIVEKVARGRLGGGEEGVFVNPPMESSDERAVINVVTRRLP